MQNELLFPDIKLLLICAPPRTGSETLCRLLTAAGLGQPQEYLNPWLYPFTKATDPNDGNTGAAGGEVKRHLSKLMKLSEMDKSPFAMKIQGWQLKKYLRNKFGLKLFRQSHIVFLARLDIQEQIISQAAAKLTGQWYDDRTDQNTFSREQIQIAYNEAKIFIPADYAAFELYFQKTHIVPDVYQSEELFADPARIVRRIAAKLDVQPNFKRLNSEILNVRKYCRQTDLRQTIRTVADSA